MAMNSTKIIALLEPAFKTIESAVSKDRDFQASASRQHVVFGITSSEDYGVLVTVKDGQAHLRAGSLTEASFSLSASPNDWDLFFQAVPTRPYQSFWGMLRVLGNDQGVKVLGDATSFSKHARIWRVLLDRARDAVHGRPGPRYDEVPTTEAEEDSIIGRYMWLDLPGWGKSKVFYESAGSGSQDLLLFHTAGADSRQNHSLMNNRELQQRCTMYAFDLPGHGRSSPGSLVSPQQYALTEDMYISCTAAVMQYLKLKSTIVCGASMAGQVCLALAMRAKELDIGGAIPLEACDHLPLSAPIYAMGNDMNESILNPERVCGMMSPTSPEYYKQSVWWGYSSQGINVFHGDLRFYFQGWDGRSRLSTIDTKACPIYMLTGKSDYSCTTEASEATAKKIHGARFEAMDNLGHFPNTENPAIFVPYLRKALDYIESEKSS